METEEGSSYGVAPDELSSTWEDSLGPPDDTFGGAGEPEPGDDEEAMVSEESGSSRWGIDSAMVTKGFEWL